MSAASNDGTNASIALAVGMVRTWVALYTLGLPRKLRQARRIEIDCDLWEQRQIAGFGREPSLGTAAEIVARTVLGILSDITWRVEAGTAARPDRSIKMNESLFMRALVVTGVLIAVLPVITGLTMVLGNGDFDSATERIAFGLASMTAGVAIVGGLVLSLRKPALGVVLILAGTVAISALWYWMMMITIPAGLAIAVIAYLRGRGTGWPNRAGTA